MFFLTPFGFPSINLLELQNMADGKELRSITTTGESYFRKGLFST